MAVYYDGSRARTPTPSGVRVLAEGSAGAPAAFPVVVPMSCRRGHPPTGIAHEGGVANFSGEETIHRGRPAGLHGRYLGGLVDRDEAIE